MPESVKIMNVNSIRGSSVSSRNGLSSLDGKILNYIKNPTILLRTGGILIILGAIIGLIITSRDHDTLTTDTTTTDTPTTDTTDTTETDETSDSVLSKRILNPKFGLNYKGITGFNEIYSDLGGNDPLKNGTLDANINIDTERYSCKFNVKYDGRNKKKVECLSGCYNDDENSKFCEGYIYNDQVEEEKNLDTIYDDAGGNESGSSGKYKSIINISAGNTYDKNDISCGFSVSYEGNNKRTVKCTNSECPEECSVYEYINRENKGEKGDTLLDETYINRRNDSKDNPCNYCNENQNCEDGKCVCKTGFTGTYCQDPAPESSPSPETPPSPSQPSPPSPPIPPSTENINLVNLDLGYIILLGIIIVIAGFKINENDKIVLLLLFLFSIYVVVLGFYNEWKWYSKLLSFIFLVLNLGVSLANIGEIDILSNKIYLKSSQVIFIIIYVISFIRRK